MGSSAVPDVRVTLSAQGVDDIVKAFQQVSAAAKKTGKESAAGVGLLNDALKNIGTVLPTLGFAAAAAGIGILVNNAVNGAVAVGKLQEKTGLATETLSTLAYGADQADVSFDSLSGGLTKFGKTMALVDQGNTAAGASVRRLLGSSQALNGLNTDQRFTKVVTALAKMSDGYQKTRAAQDFFGRSGADLLPLIDELGVDGFEKLRAKAESLGLVLSQSTVDAITVAKQALKDLNAEAQGAATEFVSGLAPAVQQAADALVAASSGGGVNGFQKLGQAVGAVAKGIVGAFLLVGSTIGFVFGEASLLVEEWGTKAINSITTFVNKAIIAIAEKTGGGDKVGFNRRALDRAQKAGAPDYSSGAGARADAFSADILKQMNGLFPDSDGTGPKKPPKKPAAGGTVTGTADATAQLAALKKALEDELALYKAQADAIATEQKRAYDDGEISLQEYFDDRAKAIQDNSQKEIDALDKEYVALEKAPIPVAANETSDQIAAKKTQRTQELADLQNKIYVAQLAGQSQLAANADARHKAELAYQELRLSVEKQIQDAQGDTYSAALAAIKKNADELASKGIPPELVTRLSTLQQSKAAFDEIGKQGSAALGELSDQQAALQNQVASGDIFPSQALDLYNAAVQAALPKLQQLATEQADAAVTPEDKQRAAQFANTINAMGAASSSTAHALSQLKGGIESGLTNSLTTFFTTGIDQAHGFADAIGKMAEAVISSIQQVVAQLLAAQIVKSTLQFLGFATGGVVPAAGSQGDSLPAASNSSGAVNVATGGHIRGPGTSTSDSIPAMLSRGEFVVRASAVRQPGNLALLQSINANAINAAIRGPSIKRLGAIPGYADGGFVPGAALGASSGAAGSRTHLLVGLEEGLVTKHMESSAGQKVIVRSVTKNKNAINSGLGTKKR